MKLIFESLNKEKILLESTLPTRILIATVGVLFIAIVGANYEKIKAASVARSKEREEKIKKIKTYIDTKSFPILNGKYDKNKTLLLNLIDFDLYKINDITRFIDNSRYMYGVSIEAISILKGMTEVSFLYIKLMESLCYKNGRVLYYTHKDDTFNLVVLEEDGSVSAYYKKGEDKLKRSTMYSNIEVMFFDEAITTYNYMVKIGKISEDSDF